MMKRRTLLLCSILFPIIGNRAFSRSNELEIFVNLPLNRQETGFLSIRNSSGNTLLSNIEVLGKSDNQRAAAEGNTSRNPTLPYGDTPTGKYSVPRAISTGNGTVYSSRSYGNAGALVLEPISGSALIAKNNGRTGLLIHSGDMRNGRLRVTHGCLRVSEEDMNKIFKAIREAGENPYFKRCEIVETSVIVGNQSEEGAGNDELDPPLGIESLLGIGGIVLD